MTTCPVCGERCQTHTVARDQFRHDCTRCGTFVLIGTINNRIRSLRPHQRSVLSHRIRRAQTLRLPPLSLVESELPSWQLDDPLPSLAERLDHLITLIGENQPGPSESANISASGAAAWIGTEIVHDPREPLRWLLEQPETQHLISSPPDFTQGSMIGPDIPLHLTMPGWQRYEALKRAESTSRNAFMAMQFNDSELDRVVQVCFRPAVEKAGFTLRILTDGQPAGTIDDQIRVALRTSRFTIADLTHDNRGAYWEAGFTEGLGRPVIYTCRKDKWEEQKTHFDTNHLVTIPWDLANLDQTGRNLTATIRATLPSEATLTPD